MGADATAMFGQLPRMLGGAADKAGALRLMRTVAEQYPDLPQALATPVMEMWTSACMSWALCPLLRTQ